MRIGIRTRPGHEATDAAAAEGAAAFGVLIEPRPGTHSIAGAEAACSTRYVRLIVRVHLGLDHPLTLAEDLAVLDNVSGGRVVALLDTGDLDVAAAGEDVALLEACLRARPVRHRGKRWQVPAGIEGHDAPERVEVTPKPVQVELPIWLDGGVAAALGGRTGRPHLVTEPSDSDRDRPVQPAVAQLSGDRDADRSLVGAWADAGATHLLVGAADLDAAIPEIGRYLIPEVAMPLFPRVVAEAMTPRPWPGPARYVDGPGA